jgi:hypothetical protein
VITVQARAAALAREIAPELFADAMTFINDMLPAPAPAADGDIARPGRESESKWAAPSATLTAPTYKAAQENNEM